MTFIGSMSARYHELLRTGDATDNPRNACKGRATWGEQERIDAEMDTAIQRIGSGEKAASVARQLGVKPATFNARLRNRGLTVRGIQSAQR
jgi:hypothetical protein